MKKTTTQEINYKESIKGSARTKNGVYLDGEFKVMLQDAYDRACKSASTGLAKGYDRDLVYRKVSQFVFNYTFDCNKTTCEQADMIEEYDDKLKDYVMNVELNTISPTLSFKTNDIVFQGGTRYNQQDNENTRNDLWKLRTRLHNALHCPIVIIDNKEKYSQEEYDSAQISYHILIKYVDKIDNWYKRSIPGWWDWLGDEYFRKLGYDEWYRTWEEKWDSWNKSGEELIKEIKKLLGIY